MANDVFVNVENRSIETEVPAGSAYTNFASVAIGQGSKVFRSDQSGIWLGAEKWADAPFRVDMEGNLTATSLSITGYIATGGAAADVNTSVTTINADKINISGSTTFAAGYNPIDKVDEVGGTYTTTSATAAKVQLFPTSSIGIRAYASNGTSVVFQVDVGGTNVGDVTIGNYAGGYGMLWDQSASTLYVKGDITAGNIDAARITSGTLSTSRIPNLSADKITSGYIDADRIEAGSLNASVLGAGTINASTINVTDLNASNISNGTYYVGGSSHPSYMVIAYTAMTGGGSGAYLRFGSTTGSRIWADVNNDMGFNAIGGEMYFYCNSSQILYLDDTAQAVIGQDNSTYDVGLFVWGNFNTGRGTARIRDGALYVNTTSSPSEKFWVGGSAGIEGNLKSNHHDPRSSDSYNLGGSSNWWAYLNCHSVTYHSMGFYDDGVTLQDGTKVSDVEAIRALKAHPTKTTEHGKPLLDKKSLPVEMFVPAKDQDGKLYERDKKTGFPLVDGKIMEDADGEDAAQLLSLALGAIKELDARIQNLEKGIN